jgi:CheY-like chemotaxis protein
MRILIAEDDAVPRRALEATLQRWGYAVTTVADGAAAWQVLQQVDAPKLALLDWIMPELDGTEVCGRVRSLKRSVPSYIILLTSKGAKQDVVKGLQAGADDYLIKPFDRDELQARLQVGWRFVQLQQNLADRVQDLEEALANVKQLQGLLPICCYCKKIRDDSNYWQQVEQYLSRHSSVQFSHGICPDCYENVVQPELQRHLANKAANETPS